jgi:hypothetical protein
VNSFSPEVTNLARKLGLEIAGRQGPGERPLLYVHSGPPTKPGTPSATPGAPAGRQQREIPVRRCALKIWLDAAVAEAEARRPANSNPIGRPELRPWPKNARG